MYFHFSFSSYWWVHFPRSVVLFSVFCWNPLNFTKQYWDLAVCSCYLRFSDVDQMLGSQHCLNKYRKLSLLTCYYCLCLGVTYVCEVTSFVDWLDNGFIYIYEKSFEIRICLWPNCPEVTLCGWKDVRIQLLTSGNRLRIYSSCLLLGAHTHTHTHNKLTSLTHKQHHSQYKSISL